MSAIEQALISRIRQLDEAQQARLLHIVEAMEPDGEDLTPPSEEEMRELLTFTSKTGAEIVAAGLLGGWEHKGIEDPVAFLEEIRRREENGSR